MSSLIKARSAPAATVQPFAGPAKVQAEGPLPAHSREQVLEAEVASLKAQIEEAELRLPELIEVARQQAADKALQAQSDAEEKQLALLGDAVESALDEWRERLSSLEGLSATLARGILERVFADGTERASAVTSTVRRRYADLDAGSIVRLRVSPADFTDEQALAAIGRMSGTNVSTIADPELGPGECVLDLKLGHIDLGPRAQWPRVAEFLGRLEEGRV